MELVRRVFANNRAWVSEMVARDPGFFERLAAEQTPEFLYIGCADSRVPANEIMGLHPGDVFVHRNVANLVVNTDVNVHAVIQYAVEHLHVRHIVVCGHYGCGGLIAAMQDRDLGLLNGWLSEVRDLADRHRDELDRLSPTARATRLVELNVYSQCRNVLKNASVQQHFRDHGTPMVHGWVYDLKNGLLENLGFPFDEELERIHPLRR